MIGFLKNASPYLMSFESLIVISGMCFLFSRGQYRMVYLTPEYVSSDTTFLAEIQKSVGEDIIEKKQIKAKVQISQFKLLGC